jgi:hypothetical protein
MNLILPKPETYLRVDFHTHTHASPDSLLTPKKMIATAKRKGLQRVVVSDHDTTRGAREAVALAPEMIIVGQEIMTAEGELLAVFVQEEVPANLPVMETIQILKAQGAFISVSHPFDPTRKGGWQVPALLRILPHIDAIETFNARCMRPVYNWRAERFAQEHGLAGTHGSDAHAAFELGRGSLWLPPFDDAASLRESIKQAVSPPLILSLPWVHLTSRYAVWVKKRRR